LSVVILITSAKEVMFSSLFVSLLATCAITSKWFAWNFREDWQWASQQMVKIWWRSGLPSGNSGYRDYFQHSSVLGYIESG